MPRRLSALRSPLSALRSPLSSSLLSPPLSSLLLSPPSPSSSLLSSLLSPLSSLSLHLSRRLYALCPALLPSASPALRPASAVPSQARRKDAPRVPGQAPGFKPPSTSNTSVRASILRPGLDTPFRVSTRALRSRPALSRRRGPVARAAASTCRARLLAGMPCALTATRAAPKARQRRRWRGGRDPPATSRLGPAGHKSPWPRRPSAAAHPSRRLGRSGCEEGCAATAAQHARGLGDSGAPARVAPAGSLCQGRSDGLSHPWQALVCLPAPRVRVAPQGASPASTSSVACLALWQGRAPGQLTRPHGWATAAARRRPARSALAGPSNALHGSRCSRAPKPPARGPGRRRHARQRGPRCRVRETLDAVRHEARSARDQGRALQRLSTCFTAALDACRPGA